MDTPNGWIQTAPLRLRFVDNLTQEQIGSRIGVSQMQVSRLLTGILATLRKRIQDPRAARAP